MFSLILGIVPSSASLFDFDFFLAGIAYPPPMSAATEPLAPRASDTTRRLHAPRNRSTVAILRGTAAELIELRVAVKDFLDRGN
jgi:hypothetical protein